MKKTQPGFWAATITTLLAAATLCLYPSFRTSAQTKEKPAAKKSVDNSDSGKSATKHSGNKMGDVDQKDIDKAMLELEQSMRQFKEQDWPKVQIEIDKALKEIDATKIQHDIELALKEVDVAGIKAEVQKALAEVQVSLKEIDVEKIKAEAVKAINQIDVKAIEKELAELKKTNAEQIKKEMAEAKEQMAKAKIDMKTQMVNAAEQLKQAKKQLQLVREGLDELEKDGLKKKGEKVTIEYRDGILYLNGNAQSKSVSDKYQHYFGSETIQINDNDEERDDEPKNKESVK